MLASLVYWRLQRVTGSVMVPVRFAVRVALSAAAATGMLLVPGIPDFVAAALSAATFLAVGQLVGMVPEEVRAALRRSSTTTPQSPRT